jgi:hypothetical protein
MVDKIDVAQDKEKMEEHAGEKLEFIGEHPEHAPQPGRKTPQEDLIDEDAIDESGNLIYDDGRDETERK